MKLRQSPNSRGVTADYKTFLVQDGVFSKISRICRTSDKIINISVIRFCFKMQGIAKIRCTFVSLIYFCHIGKKTNIFSVL